MKPARERGFTFIEVVVTIFVLGVTIALFLAALNTLTFTRSVRHEDVALRIANQKLEELRGGGYASLPMSGTFNDPLLDDLPDGSASITVSDYNAKVKQVLVAVSWQDPGKAARTVTLTTLLTDIGGL